MGSVLGFPLQDQGPRPSRAPLAACYSCVYEGGGGIWLKSTCSTSVRCRLDKLNVRDKDSSVRERRTVVSLSIPRPKAVRVEREERRWQTKG